MKIKINLTKKQIIPLISAVIILIGIILVYAQSTPNPGHSINEISGVPDCTSSQSLTHNSSGFFCIFNSANSGNIAISGNLTVNSHLFLGIETASRSGSLPGGGKFTVITPCPAGKKVIGCTSNNCLPSMGAYPISNSSCSCTFYDESICNCVATCANIDS
jgi:hypothetical protein